MNHATTRCLLHPSILLDHTQDLRVANIGCGTGQSPPQRFDISDQQFPKGDPYGGKVLLSKLDIFQPVPEHLRGKHDVIHVRCFVVVATDGSVQVAVDDLSAMLEPGGYLEWDEENSISKMAVYTSRMNAAQAQLRCYIRRHLWPRTKSDSLPLWCGRNGRVDTSCSWVNNTPSYFQRSGLDVFEYDTQAPLPMYRDPWMDDFLLAYAEVGDKMGDGDEQDWFREMHAKAVEDADNGWHLDWELIMCVGKKLCVA